MARFIIEKHCKQPDWALMLLATFPFDRTKNYPDIERYAIMGCVLNYLEEFTYRRRNAMQQLCVTHNLHCRENSITIETANGNAVLTISLIVDN